MAYQALYRKYRPQNFDDIFAQEYVVRALRNQVTTGRIGHAYLFSGPRGTGKTSAAKLFARAINCRDPHQGDPCGQCPSCLDAMTASVDIAEIDAASNNSVDKVREMQEGIKYLPAVGRYRVYIIDEVHMLSTSAFNALLKTLEEPPGHVVFILATTEPQKLPATVLSRCQRFEFKRIPPDKIRECLAGIARSEGTEAEEEALGIIAQAADGALRDAISLLDQCINLSEGKLNASLVISLLGTASQRDYLEMLEALLQRDVPAALRLLERFLAGGGDLRLFASEICRRLSLVYAAGFGVSCAKEYEAVARGVSPERILRCLELFSDAESRLRYAANPRVLIELAIFQCCSIPTGEDYSALVQRLEALEQGKQTAPQAVTAPKASAAPVAPEDIPLPEVPPWEEDFIPGEPPPVSVEEAREEPNVEAVVPQAPAPRPGRETAPVAKGGDSPSAKDLWQKTKMGLAELGKGNISGLMEHGVGSSLSDGVLTVRYAQQDEAAANMLSSAQRKAVVEQALSEQAGQTIKLMLDVYAYTPEQQKFLEESSKYIGENLMRIKKH